MLLSRFRVEWPTDHRGGLKSSGVPISESVRMHGHGPAGRQGCRFGYRGDRRQEFLRREGAKAGLSIRSGIDDNGYATSIRATDDQMEA